LLEDVGGLVEEHQLVEEHADFTPLQQHIIMRENLHHINSCMGCERWRLVDQ
jgi:hypothetical protein